MTTARLGWRLASFLTETLHPAPDDTVDSHALFDAYLRWCDRRDEVPYLEGVFLHEVAALAAAADIPIHQSGSDISFAEVVLKAASSS